MKLFDFDEMYSFQMIELLQLQKELSPIYNFTTKCESDHYNQANVFIAYRTLEVELETLNSPRSLKILELVRSRFNSTANINISKLCYFVTNAGISEKREIYPHVDEHETFDPHSEDAEKLDKEIKFISSFTDTIKYICEKISIDVQIIIDAFAILMKFYIPVNNDINDFPKKRDLRDIFIEITGDDKSYLVLAYFIEILQVLPASEAACKRIFARMLDLYKTKQTRLSAKSLRSNLILSFYSDFPSLS